jgi:hypothetical protein
MKLGMGCFGLTCALLIAVPVTSAVVTEMRRSAERVAHPFGRYQLTFTIDGNSYIADHDLTLADCIGTQKSTEHDLNSFRNGAGQYSCDLQPEVN